MLIPLSRQKFEELIPVIAIGPQYLYYWGKFPDFLKRLLISVISLVILLIINSLVKDDATIQLLSLLLSIIGGLYWFWSPIYFASMRNTENRRNEYAAFWQGRIEDYFVTDEVVGEEQTVNKKGQLVIIENRQKTLNIEVGDNQGFFHQLKVPLNKSYKVIRRGEIAEMLVLSNRRDFSNIVAFSEIYLPDHKLWISDYPMVRKDLFIDISKKMQMPRYDDNYDDDNYDDDDDDDDDYPPPKPKKKSRRNSY